MNKWIWAIVAFVLLIVAVPMCSSYQEESTVTTEVFDKERVCDSESCKYLVYTEAGTFAVSDSFIIGRWNSSDVYGRIKPGETYMITSIGWRIPFFSTYPNIKEIVEVSG